MILEESNDWSKGDSTGRNAFMYIFHPDQTWIKEAFMKCVRVRDDSFVQFYRYPNERATDMSRDHVAAIILALYINRDKELQWILNNLPWRLSRKYAQTIDFWLWQKSLKAQLDGNEFKYSILRQLFLGLNLIMFLFIVPWNFLLRLILGVKIIQPSQLETLELSPKKKWKLWIYQKLLYPHFALYNLVWQVRSLHAENSLLSNLLKIECKNPVLKSILGKEITEEEYKSYIPIAGFQWAGTLDNMIEWKPRILTEPEYRFNDLTKSNLDYFYYGIDKIMFGFGDKIVEKIKNNQNIIFY